MKKHMLLLFIFLLGCAIAMSQTLSQTYLDPCDNKIYTLSFPITNVGTLVVIRNEAKVFTYEDFRSGKVTQWVNLIFSKPCPAIQQTVQQTITQSVTQTVSSTTSSLTSATASMSSATTSTPPPTSSSTPTTQSGDGGNVSTTDNNSSSSETQSGSSESSSESQSNSSSEDSKGESKSESKKEDKKTEEKKKEDKKEAVKNPIMMASDLTVAEDANKNFATILSIGFSKSSLAGDASYGANAMVWSNLKQFVIGATYNKTNYEKGKPKNINSYNLSGVYLNGNLVNLASWTHIVPTKKMGTYGWNVSMINVLLLNTSKQNYQWNDKLGYLNGLMKRFDNYDYNGLVSVVGFWMKPYVINKRLMISPQAFVILSPFNYNSISRQAEITINNNSNVMMGSSFDYKISKRFGFSFNYKVSGNVQTNPSILHNFLIGSRMLL